MEQSRVWQVGLERFGMAVGDGEQLGGSFTGTCTSR